MKWFKKLRAFANAFYGGTITENRKTTRMVPGTRPEGASDTDPVPIVEETIDNVVERDMNTLELAAARKAYIDQARALYLVIDE